MMIRMRPFFSAISDRVLLILTMVLRGERRGSSRVESSTRTTTTTSTSSSNNLNYSELPPVCTHWTRLLIMSGMSGAAAPVPPMPIHPS